MQIKINSKYIKYFLQGKKIKSKSTRRNHEKIFMSLGECSSWLSIAMTKSFLGRKAFIWLTA